MSLRSFFAMALDAVFPAKRKRVRDWETMTAERFAATAAKSAHDAVLSRANAVALFSYGDPLVKEALHALKYQGERSLGAVFGTLLADMLKEEMGEHALLSDAPPLLIPVPLTFGRHVERSYNQTELIAQEVAKRLPEQLVYAPDALIRNRARGSQARSASWRERASNVRGAFGVPHPERITDRDIILLDDIITTGATANEAAATLLSFGARSVSCIAVAH
jgi:ComF family protein